MNNLLILGEQHKFSKLEIEELEKKFLDINFIAYKDMDTDYIIQLISDIIKTNKQKTIIVLNIKALIPNKLLKYLTNSIKKDKIAYLTLPSFMERYLEKSYIPDDLTDISFLEKIQPFSFIQKSIKGIIEYSIVIFLIIFTSPLMIYAIYRIKKDSPGPTLFKQKRVGKDGQEFECIKFRSMHIDAEKDGAKFATKNDDRVYPWGKVMRTTRIDELPQLWNVLKGDMHLIGPRPERKIWIEQFEKEIPYYNERHVIKPGLTGWAQVLYPYGANTYDAQQKLMYDLYYIKNWSLWLELKTIWKTVKVILYRKGV
jgi:exopolysaccharide biosynthesis polyprenyl glycosylphosphotransferase